MLVTSSGFHPRLSDLSARLSSQEAAGPLRAYDRLGSGMCLRVLESHMGHTGIPSWCVQCVQRALLLRSAEGLWVSDHVCVCP